MTERKEEAEVSSEEELAAAKVDYKLTDRVDISLEQQVTLKGDPNNQTTFGIEARISEGLSLRGERTSGTKGAATSIGITGGVADKFEVSADYTRADSEMGEIPDSASLSASAKLGEKTEVYTTYDTQSASGSQGRVSSLTFGSKMRISDELEAKAERTSASSEDRITLANTYGLAREKDGRRLEGTFTQQHSESSTDVSSSNIFGLSGDISGRWALSGTYEEGVIQNYDGTETARKAVSLGLGYVKKDEDTGEVTLKASSKVEFRFDEAEEDRRQYVSYHAVEGKITRNTTLFAKMDSSRTENITTEVREAKYEEFVLGAAYRPIDFDWINLLARYTYLVDDSPESQADISDIEEEKARVIEGQAVIDLGKRWQISEKLAYKMGEEKVTGFDFTETSTRLWITRLGCRLSKRWQVAAEYRVLTQEEARDEKRGILVEITTSIGTGLQLSVGYNFTDFNDDLTHLDYNSYGPFVRAIIIFPREAQKK